MEAVSFFSVPLGSTKVTVTVAPAGVVWGMTISSSRSVGVMRAEFLANGGVDLGDGEVFRHRIHEAHAMSLLLSVQVPLAYRPFRFPPS